MQAIACGCRDIRRRNGKHRHRQCRGRQRHERQRVETSRKEAPSAKLKERERRAAQRSLEEEEARITELESRIAAITTGRRGACRSLRTSLMKCFRFAAYSSCPPYWSFQPWNQTKPASS